jgi:hypothetical protein
MRKKRAMARVPQEVEGKATKYPFAQSRMTIRAGYEKICAILPHLLELLLFLGDMKNPSERTDVMPAQPGRYIIDPCPCSIFDLTLGIRLAATIASDDCKIGHSCNTSRMSADRHCKRATQLEKGSRIRLEAGVLDRSPQFTQRVVHSDDANHRPPGRQ